MNNTNAQTNTRQSQIEYLNYMREKADAAFEKEYSFELDEAVINSVESLGLVRSEIQHILDMIELVMRGRVEVVLIENAELHDVATQIKREVALEEKEMYDFCSSLKNGQQAYDIIVDNLRNQIVS